MKYRSRSLDYQQRHRHQVDGYVKRIIDPIPTTQKTVSKPKPIQKATPVSAKKQLPKRAPAKNARRQAQNSTRLMLGQFKQEQTKQTDTSRFVLPRYEFRFFTAGILFAVGLIALGFYLGISRPTTTASTVPEVHTVEIRTQGGPVEAFADQVETVEVSVDPGIDIEDVDWRPPPPIEPDMPARFKLPKFGVDANVRALGITETGQLAVPNWTSWVGWFDGSVKPGEPGTVVMDGHYGIPAGTAAFGHLKDLVPGDIITIQNGTGEEFNYAVDYSEAYELGNVPMDRLIASDGVERLHLITCNGSWDAAESTYDSRLMVFATRVE